MTDSAIDRWVQRATFLAMVALAATLLGFGVRLYVHPPQTFEGPIGSFSQEGHAR